MKSVFVAGCPRSGTTLLGAMLGSHSDCLATPESKFNLQVYRASIQSEAARDAATILEQIRDHWSFKIWDVDVDPAQLLQAGTHQPYGQVIHWLVSQYGKKVGKPSPAFWIDHTPETILHSAVLFALYPEARMIHLVRDGRAVAASVLKLDWGPNVIDLAAHWWVQWLAHGLAAEQHFGPQRVMRVRYEALVTNPQTVLSEICRFLEIDFQPDMVNGSGLHVPSYTAGQHQLVGAAPQARRIDAWQQELSPRRIEIFESIAGNLLACLDYEGKYGLQARASTPLEKLIANVQSNYRARVVNRFRHAIRLRRSLATAAPAR